MRTSVLLVLVAASSMSCVVEPEQPIRRTPGVVVPSQTNVYEDRHDTSNTRVKSTTTIQNQTTIVSPGAATMPSQPADDIQKFDKDGNPNYDADGDYIGGHGVGTLVDNPDAPSSGSSDEDDAGE